MSKFHVEPVSGGLVTARPPLLLNEGELSVALGIYRPFSQSLWNAPANATFATGSGGITGLRYAGFDYRTVPLVLTSGNTTVTTTGTNTLAGISTGATIRGQGIPENTTLTVVNTTTGTLSNAATETNTNDAVIEADSVVVVQDGTDYKIAKATNTTSTLAVVESSVAASTTLDSVAYNNQHVLLNGRHPNRVLLANGTTRQHGMKPMLTAPSLNTTTGTWTAPEGAGFYSYWTTEWDSANKLESDFQGKKPAVVNVSTTSLKVVATKPTTLNAEATHWRLYRSVKMESTNTTSAASENIFPNGNLVGEAPITQLTIEDGGTVSSTSALPAGSVGQADVAWVNPTNALGATNGTLAVCGPVAGQNLVKVLELGTFALPHTTMVAPITGIQVVVRASNTTAGVESGRLYVQLKTTNDPQFQQTVQYEVPLTTTLANYTLGGPTDDWGLLLGSQYGAAKSAWTPGDFADGKFTVLLRATPNSATVSVDSVTVSVSYGTGYANGTVTPFPSIAVTYAGITTATGRNGQPPKATTGDMFQECLVLNDVTQGNVARYSFPGSLDAFPPQYFFNLNTQEQDIMTCIRSVGNSMVFGMAGRLWRVTYLPREQDAEFDRGRAIELLDAARGIVGPLAASRFTYANGQQMLALFSGNSFSMTDAYKLMPVTNDIDFDGLVEPAYLSQTEVTDNPELFELCLLYVPKGGTTKTGILRFSYHPTHIKQDGTLKCSAGSMGTVRAASGGVLRGGTRVLYTTNGTTIYRENQVPTGAVSVTWKTRQMTWEGLGRAQKVTHVRTHVTQYGYSSTSPGTVSHTLRGHRDNTAQATTDGDYTRTDTARTTAIPAFPAGTSVLPRDRHVLRTPVNFGDNVVSNSAALNSTAGCHYAVDFTVYEYEPHTDEYPNG